MLPEPLTWFHVMLNTRTCAWNFLLLVVTWILMVWKACFRETHLLMGSFTSENLNKSTWNQDEKVWLSRNAFWTRTWPPTFFCNTTWSAGVLMEERSKEWYLFCSPFLWSKLIHVLRLCFSVVVTSSKLTDCPYSQGIFDSKYSQGHIRGCLVLFSISQYLIWK